MKHKTHLSSKNDQKDTIKHTYIFIFYTKVLVSSYQSYTKLVYVSITGSLESRFQLHRKFHHTNST